MEFQNKDFIQLVKRTREKFGVSNHDRECRKQAIWDMRHKGRHSRFMRDGERIRFAGTTGNASGRNRSKADVPIVKV